MAFGMTPEALAQTGNLEVWEIGGRESPFEGIAA